MSRTSKPTSFADRLKEQTAEEEKALRRYRGEIEALMKEQLRALGQALRQLCAVELQRTERGIRAEMSATARRLGARWLRTMVAGAILFVAIWSSAWLMGRWFQDEIREQMRAAIEQAIEEHRQEIGAAVSEE